MKYTWQGREYDREGLARQLRKEVRLFPVDLPKLLQDALRTPAHVQVAVDPFDLLTLVERAQHLERLTEWVLNLLEEAPHGPE